MKIGDKLNNGAIVLDYFDNDDKSMVLALTAGTCQPFVFWHIDKDGNTCCGQYFYDLSTAVCEFEAVAQY